MHSLDANEVPATGLVSRRILIDDFSPVRRQLDFPLGVLIVANHLLIVGDEKPARRKATKSNGRRPAGKVREVFDRVSKLPRRQQEHIITWISAYVSQYEQSR